MNNPAASDGVSNGKFYTPKGRGIKPSSASGGLKKMAGWYLIFALVWGLFVSSESVAGANDLSQTIQYLLDFVKNSQCRFYRNNKEHSAGEVIAAEKVTGPWIKERCV